MTTKEKKLRIGWLWNTPERWLFHGQDKRLIYAMCDEGKLNLKTLYSMLFIDESWLIVGKDEKCAPNYPMLYHIWIHFKGQYKKLKPPLLFKLVTPKIGVFILTLFKEDTAYSERIGGAIQFIIDNETMFRVNNTPARVRALRAMQEWWKNEEWRPRTYKVINWLFDTVIEYYEKEPYVRQCLDYWIMNILANKHLWHTQPSYDPKNWYPRGKGQVNYLVTNREGFYDKAKRSVRWS